MKEKITIAICAGTTCYMMGGAELLTLEDALPENLKSQVHITGANCLGLCKERGKQAPFVKIGKTILENASIDKVTQRINDILEEDNHEPRK